MEARSYYYCSDSDERREEEEDSVEIEGKLCIKLSKELNQAGQAPIDISFVGPDGMRLDVLGVRYKNGFVLDATASTQRGWTVYHTHFSDALQHAIINGHESKKHEADGNYQQNTSEEMMRRSRAAQT